LCKNYKIREMSINSIILVVKIKVNFIKEMLPTLKNNFHKLIEINPLAI